MSHNYVDVYKKDYLAKGCVNLGTKKAAGFSGVAVSNYIVYCISWATGYSLPTCTTEVTHPVREYARSVAGGFPAINGRKYDKLFVFTFALMHIWFNERAEYTPAVFG